jgi:hypothetical protein
MCINVHFFVQIVKRLSISLAIQTVGGGGGKGGGGGGGSHHYFGIWRRGKERKFGVVDRRRILGQRSAVFAYGRRRVLA